MNTNNTQKTTVKCPTCKTLITWTKNNPHRPFCSECCRNKDFVAWANEENVMEGNSLYEDLMSEDLSH